MRRISLCLLLAFALLSPAASAQSLHPCFDLNGDSASTLVDLLVLSDYFIGGPALPPGHGDIDGRDDINLGDSRFFIRWIFFGEPVGSCPPHPAYSILPGVDSLVLGSVDIPPGDGQVQIPILLKSQNTVLDILIPFQALTTSGSVSIASIDRINTDILDLFNKNWLGADGVAQFSSIFDDYASPGIYILATVTVDYSGSTGGVVSLEPTAPSSYQFPHYVHGAFDQPYANTTIALLPVATGPQPPVPVMSVDPDSLYFETLVAYPNPDPQSFTVLSDGDLFAWTLTHDSFLQVTPTSGVSGQSVEVAPDITGLGVGTHHATVVVQSAEAIGSPRIVDVYIKLKAQYPAFDANCDGQFSIGDIVTQINYIFGGGVIECDPCTGQPFESEE